jgi:phage gp16-like protein
MTGKKESKGNDMNRSRFPSGMTAKKDEGEGRSNRKGKYGDPSLRSG